MLVEDVMTRDVATVSPEIPVREAIRTLAGLGITSMPVVDGRGVLLGILSEADLLADAVLPDPRAHLRPTDADLPPARVVDEVYTRMPRFVRPHDDVTVAVDTMLAGVVKSLPVVDAHHRVVGMVSRSDVVHALARTDTTIAADVTAALAALGRPDWTVDVDGGVVAVTGPDGEHEWELADVAARTVPGVVGVERC